MWLLLGIYSFIAGVWVWLSPSTGWNTGYGLSATLGLLPIFLVIAFVIQVQKFPPTNDISTDTQTPPALTFASQVRHASHNSTIYQETAAQQQKQAYRAIQPLVDNKPVEQVLSAVNDVVAEMTWEVQIIEAETGIIEATDTTVLFGFVDDIAIRIRSADEGITQVDIRSASRIGVSDLGTNAQRIEQFMMKLQQRLGNSESI